MTEIFVGRICPRTVDQNKEYSKSEKFMLVEKSELIVEPVPDILTAIKMPKFAKTTVKEFEK
jgi:hypothetical protein